MHAQPSKRLLRILVVAELLMIVLGVAVALLTEPSLPEPLRDWVQAEAEVEPTAGFLVLTGFGFLMVVALVVSNIGLFFFWRFARPLYLVTTLAPVLLLPAFGPDVSSGWAAMFDDLGMILSGIIIALIYWSPLRDLFERPAPPAS
jgi:phosphoglycerol transferase MdoB-like AlkP superfamily enzyme